MEEDYIISLNNKEEYLKITNIEEQGQPYYYKAFIVQDHFSQELKNIINEFWEYVDLFSLFIIDELEQKIKEYNFVLHQSKYKVFDIELKGDYVTFFEKYPTSKTFLNDYLK